MMYFFSSEAGHQNTHAHFFEATVAHESKNLPTPDLDWSLWSLVCYVADEAFLYTW